jgi:hypothetical protein
MEVQYFSYILCTIYTDIIRYIKDIFMKKVCKICSIPKLISEFYKRMTSCKYCWNKQRRENYKKSVCKYCSIEFRPGIEGRYKFCSEKCRFMDKVEIGEDNKCWLWKGHIQSKKGGYGTFVPIGERNGLAHRTAYRLFKGNIPKDSHILHSCDNTICVSPNHLRLGNALENSKEKIEKGRANNSFPGESNPSHKLSKENVIEIRKRASLGESYSSISKDFNMTPECISSVVRRKTWKQI